MTPHRNFGLSRPSTDEALRIGHRRGRVHAFVYLAIAVLAILALGLLIWLGI